VKNVSYLISTKSVEGLGDAWKSSFMALDKQGIVVGKIWQKIGAADNVG
jgi:hypothetical protein